ncbi:hypothetical protein V5R04_07265 [Jonesiaceae bacterium BS-20]|uniref:Uncharacterized protein n=1 Tax=Jonesiaceae bacterium BS-20 TaxID=3120821 RepID=A0AAU7DXW5_9MICO
MSTGLGWAKPFVADWRAAARANAPADVGAPDVFIVATSVPDQPSSTGPVKTPEAPAASAQPPWDPSPGQGSLPSATEPVAPTLPPLEEPALPAPSTLVTPPVSAPSPVVDAPDKPVINVTELSVKDAQPTGPAMLQVATMDDAARDWVQARKGGVYWACGVWTDLVPTLPHQGLAPAGHTQAPQVPPKSLQHAVTEVLGQVSTHPVTDARIGWVLALDGAQVVGLWVTAPQEMGAIVHELGFEMPETGGQPWQITCAPPIEPLDVIIQDDSWWVEPQTEPTFAVMAAPSNFEIGHDPFASAGALLAF